MGLRGIREAYEKLGRDDPLWAVLTDDRFRHNRWDPVEFFATGRREVDEVERYMEQQGLELRGGRALDFGCGVGRLSQALCQHFLHVVGVDISQTMVEAAHRFNQWGDRCRYVVNTKGDLSLLDDDSFDFVYSNKTLQHMPPEYSAEYVREFFRVLKPGCAALFVMRGGPHHEADSLGKRLYDFRTRRLMPGLKRFRGRPPIEMHYTAPSKVVEIIEAAGGKCHHILDLTPKRRSRKRLRYCATLAP